MLYSTQIDAQKLMPQFEYGYGSYSMKGLRQYNESLTSNAPINSILVSDFPSGWYYRPSLLLKYKITNLGVLYTYQTTYSEVRGENDTAAYQADMNVSSHCPGLYGELSIFYSGNWTLSADASIGFIFSDLKFNEYFKSKDSVFTDQKSNYKALSYFAEPGLQIKYSYKHFDFGINAGYFITIATEAYYTNDEFRDQFSNPYTGSSIKPQWNGFRMGASVSYFIYRKTVLKPTTKYRGRR
jgi:hypothetical protein